MRKYLQLIKNTGLFALASISTKLISFLFLPLYTACLTTAEYATVDMAIVMQSLLWPILSISLTEGLLRFAMDKDNDSGEVFSICSILIIPGFLISGILFLIINFNETLFYYRYYFLLYYIVVSLNSYLSVAARTINKIKLIVFNSISASLITAICNIFLLVKLQWGVKGYFTALIVGNAFSMISYFIAGKMYNLFSAKYRNYDLLKSIVVYSLPMIPNTIFWWINSSLDKFCLTTMVGLGAVGLYSVAGKISSSLTLFTTIFNQAWSISAIEQYKDDDSNLFFSNVFNLYNIMLSTLAAILLILVKPISQLLFAKEFYSAWIYVPFLIIAFYFNALNVFYGSIFTAFKKTNLIFWTTGAGALINVFFNIILIKVIGAMGAAFATAFSNYIVYQVRCIWVKRYIKLRTITVCNIMNILFLFLLSVSQIAEYPRLSGIIMFFFVVCTSYNLKKTILPQVKSILRGLRGRNE